MNLQDVQIGMRVRALPGCDAPRPHVESISRWRTDTRAIVGSVYRVDSPASYNGFEGQFKLVPESPNLSGCILGPEFFEPADSSQSTQNTKERTPEMETRLIVKPDGSVVRESFSSVDVTADVETMLRTAALRNHQVVTPSLGSPSAFASDFRMAFPLALRAGSPWLAAFRLSNLNFHSTWEEFEGHLRPSFGREGLKLDPAGMNTLACPIPEFVELWFFLTLRWKNPAPESPAAFMSVLVPASECAAPRRWSLLPVPNTYTDGNLCFGATDERISGEHPILQAKKLLDIWTAAPWNSDLFDGLRDRFNRLFKWTPDGKLVGTNKATWAANCPAISGGGSELIEKFMQTRLEELADAT